jgi:hypothetical protein
LGFRCRAAVLAKVGEQIKVLVSGLHLETNPGRTIALVERDAVAQYAMNEIHGRSIEDNEVDGPPEVPLEPCG